MIITLFSFGRDFSPLSNLNIKLPSFTVPARKERKEDTQCVPGLTEIKGKACIDAHVRMSVHDIALRYKDI
jgi:hypothetical protein